MSLKKNFLWNSFKGLKNIAEIFINEMTLDLNNTPKKYVVIEDDLFDGGSKYGDGNSLLRRVDFNIRIYADKYKDIENITDAYINKLKSLNLNYNVYPSITDPMSDRYSKLITSRYYYNE